MKKWIFVIMLSALLIGIACTSKDSTSDQSEGKLKLDTKMQKTSYAMGFNMVQNLKGVSPDLDIPAIVQGVKDAGKGKSPKIKMEEIAALLGEFQQKIGRRRIQPPAVNKELAEQNKVTGENFLMENAKKKGIKVTASGLQYEVLKSGEGENPAATDTVKVHYQGTLLDGKEFDSSFKRGEPIEFPLNRVIKGWTEGVQLMKKGAKYRFFIPSNLAYGPNGTPDRKIGPNATLIFEVQLIDIKKEQ